MFTTQLRAGLVQRILSGPLRLADEEASFSRRGFKASSPEARLHLERVGRMFLQGYRVSLALPVAEELALRLEAVEAEHRGFAFEGAAMGLALLDWLAPAARSRVVGLLRASESRHVYMVFVGAGWALARLRRSPSRYTLEDPLLGWLAVDGYGFSSGYFRHDRYVTGRSRPRRLAHHERRVFDQGLGRSLWFVFGADVDAVNDAVNGFHRSRQADLWSGVGLAATYAGPGSDEELARLRTASGIFASELGQGAAFAAKARLRAGNPTAHTENACSILCGLTAADAADLTDLALPRIRPGCGVGTPQYFTWRHRVRQLLRETVRA